MSKEFTGKDRMLMDWVSVRNAILRAASGEMKVTYKNHNVGGGVVGLLVELELEFDEPLKQEFTEDEKSAIDAAKKLKESNPDL